MSYTDRFRTYMTILFIGLVVLSAVGWWVDKDPGGIAPILGWVGGALGVGEASNIGKRATYKGRDF